MPKIRSVKRELLRNEELADAGLPATLVFIGLIIAVADDDGRFKASTRYLKQECVPYHPISEEQIGEALACLATEKMIGLYVVDGRNYGVIANWKKHQWIPPSRYEKSSLPPPPAQVSRILGAGKAHTSRIQEHAPEQAESMQEADTAQPSRAGGKEGNGWDRKGEDIASPNGEALARLKELRTLVCGLWKKQRGWTKWPADRRHDAIEITEWLKAKPYPAEFWEWAMPQVPADTQSFVRLTTPPDDGKVVWLEEKFIRWREARDAERRKDEAYVPSIGDLLKQGAA